MDSNLNITVRVAGRQAQAELRAVGREIKQVQSMIGQTPTIHPTSKYSPAIAQRQARLAQTAAKQAAAAQTRILNQAWKRQTAQAKIASAQQTRILTQAWNRQQVAHKQNQNQIVQQQKAANARALAQQKAHEKRMAKLGGASPLGFAKNLGASSLVNAGKNINWVGRQLTYNFTLPLALAGGALFKFAMDNEKAMTGLRKLYGNVGDDTKVLKAETDALGKSFELMSSRFGIAQAEVIGVGASWAAVGAAGVAVAEGTRATIETAILGDIELAAATEALIAVQQQWGFSTMKNGENVSELTLALAQLNMIENVSGAAMQDLLEVNERAGGVARTAGLSIGELGALTAALVPATGSAAQAGTALRSIISSLQAPTKASQDILAEMGVTVSDPSWLGATAIEKIQMMAEEFNDLSDAQKTVVSSTVATKWQVSRFDIVMRDILDPLGKYHTAMTAIANDSDVLKQRERELGAVLDSNPKKFDILMNVMKNTLTSAFIPMIPAIMSLVGLISELATAFSELSPQTQTWIMTALAAIAVLGPLMSLLGSTMQLLGVFGSVIKGLGVSIGWLMSKALWPLVQVLGEVGLAIGTAVLGPLAAFIAANAAVIAAIVAVIAAIVGSIVLILKTDLEDRIWDIIQSIAKAFWELPKAIGQALMAVLRVIGAVMTGIIEALSYLNPFARHSPSLVDNVKAGVATILDEYSKLRRIPSMVSSAANALTAFSTATDSKGQSFREIELQGKANRATAASPEAGASANNLVQQIMRLESTLPDLEREIAAQERVVDNWTQALKQADDQIAVMERSLSTLEAQYDSIGDAINAANDKIGSLVDTPIQGLGALEDQIFANTHAQNLLNMELLEFERRGVSLDSIRDKYAEMAGEVETLRGTQAELRNAGAGSDILSWYDDQISAIGEQKKEMGAVEDQIEAIQGKLDALDLEQRFLELTKAINFDPLERQIDKIANRMVEMPFDEIVRQIREQQGIVDALAPQYEEIGNQVEREREAIDAAKQAREGIAAQLDIEEQKLDGLKSAYSAIKDLIQDMESAMTEFASAATEAEQAIKDMAGVSEELAGSGSLFEAGEGLDWADQGGTGQLGREGGLAEIEAFNKQMQDELEKALADMGNLDILGTIQGKIDELKNLDFIGPLKTALGNLWTWWNDTWEGIFKGLLRIFTENGAMIWQWTNDHVIQPIWQAIQAGWAQVTAVWDVLWQTLVVPVQNFGQTVYDTLFNWFSTAFGAVQLVATTAWGAIVLVFQESWATVSTILGWLWDRIDGYIIPIFELFSVSAQIAWKLITMAFQIGWGALQGIFMMMGEAVDLAVIGFDWLRSEASRAWQLLGAGIDWVWANVIEPVFNHIDAAVDNVVVPAFTWAWTEGERIFRSLGTALGWVFDNMIAPVFDRFMDIFQNVVAPAFNFLRDSVIKPVMQGIHFIIAHVWNLIASVIEGGVNLFIGAFNLLAGAVNAVAGFLSIDARVTPMDPLKLTRIDSSFPGWPAQASGGAAPKVNAYATGGILPTHAHGGVYNAPRAIVGEGSKIYPEFVIPTDPQYRGNALSLLQQAGTRLLATGGVVSQFETLSRAGQSWKPPTPPKEDNRSWLDKAIGAVVGAGKAVVRGALTALWNPLKNAAGFAADKIPMNFLREGAHGIIGTMDDWVRGRSGQWDDAAAQRDQMLEANIGGVGPTGSGATSNGIPITQGSGSWQAFVTLLKRMNIPYTNLGTYANRNTARTGNLSWHALNRAMDFGGTQANLLRVNHALYDAFKPYLHELIFTAPGARNVWNGKDHTFRADIAGDHRTHVHASMARGGRFQVPHIPGGVNIAMSEGRQGEQFQILPIDDGATGAGTTININGNLEFPNIKNGGDAKDFIENLRALAN